jgi:hypothetical protein
MPFSPPLDPPSRPSSDFLYPHESVKSHFFDNVGLVLRWAHLPGHRNCLGELRNQLDQWASRWNLATDWVFDHALSTLSEWAVYPDKLKSYLWASNEMIFLFPDSRRYEAHWWKLGESFASFRKRAKRDLLDAFEKDVRETKQKAVEAGWPLQPARYSERTFLGTVRTHVLNEPYSRVAEDFGVDTKTLTDSIKRLSRFLGLPERQRATGRPPGARDRHRARRRN